MFLHGAGCGSIHFSDLLNRVGAQCRGVAIDLPGHGSSPAPEPFWLPSELLEQYRDCAVEVAEKLAMGRYVVVGHSMGGAVAQLMALDYPDRVAGVVLLATAGRLKVSPAVLNVIRHQFDRLPAMMAAAGYSPATPPEKAAAMAQGQVQADQQVVLSDFRACCRVDVRHRLAGLTHRVAVLSAADDLLTPPKLQRRLVDLLPRAQRYDVARAGHFMYAERPDAVAEAVLSARAWIAEDPGPADRVRPPKPTV